MSTMAKFELVFKLVNT